VHPSTPPPDPDRPDRRAPAPGDQPEFELPELPGRGDPRLEIPEILRKPVDHPSLRPKEVSPVTSGLSELGKALAIGLDFLFTITAGGLLGYLLDRWWGSAPAGLMIGLGIGFAAATFRIIQRTSREERLATARRQTQRRP
jgi:ATP synthase protein I